MNNTKPIEVLIVNVHSTLNAGDSALLWLNLRQLMIVFPKANFAALVNYPNESFNEYFPKLTVLPSPFALVKAGSGLSNWIKTIVCYAAIDWTFSLGVGKEISARDLYPLPHCFS
jgi:hypothetical protein